MPDKINAAIQSILAEKFGMGIKIEEMSSLSGGSINEAAKIKTNQGLFFAKWNDSKLFPQMLELEAKGLAVLKSAGEIQVPEVIAQKTIDTTQYLVLEYIGSSAPAGSFWGNFGRSLARMHKHSAEKFGLGDDNYIGSLPQSNRKHSTWNEFFIRERLEPQVKMALDAKRIDHSLVSQFSKLFLRLKDIFPEEKPSLLHGDLWSGNYLAGSDGEPYLIDPAVYYGHREMDIAMTKLFGGFSPEFYEAYDEEFPLAKDWQLRTDICNLYPLMVHVNLFGGSYTRQVKSILSRF